MTRRVRVAVALLAALACGYLVASVGGFLWLSWALGRDDDAVTLGVLDDGQEA